MTGPSSHVGGRPYTGRWWHRPVPSSLLVLVGVVVAVSVARLVADGLAVALCAAVGLTVVAGYSVSGSV